MDDLRGRGQGPQGQGPPGQGQGRGGVFQRSDTNSSSPSDHVNRAVNAEFLRNLLSLSSTPALGSLNNNSNTNGNAELLRRLLSSGHPASAVSNPPAGESVESELRREILRLSMGGSEQNTQSNPLNGLILNNGPSSALNNGPVNDTSRDMNDVPQTTADLSPEELHIVSLMRRKIASLQNASSIPERATVPSIEEQLTLLIQQQHRQQPRASSASDVLHPTSRHTADFQAGQQYSQQSSLDYLQPLHLQSDGLRLPDGLIQQPSRDHLQPPSHLQSDGLTLPGGLLQLQLQRQLQNLVGVAGQQPSQQQAVENLQYQQHGQSDRAILPDGLLQAQQQSQGPPALAGQQPFQQLTMEQLQYYHQLQQNDRAVLPDTHLQASVGSSPLLSLAENTSIPPDGSTEPTAASGTPTARRQRKKEAFPGKLYRLLADAESRGNSHIISFTPDGNAFKIHDPVAFMKDVAPRYFDQTHFTSFVRQLNLYGFDRVSHGHERGAFIHPNFLRGRNDLASRIQRQIVPPRVKHK